MNFKRGLISPLSYVKLLGNVNWQSVTAILYVENRISVNKIQLFISGHSVTRVSCFPMGDQSVDVRPPLAKSMTQWS